jgi:hypothetical protein
MKKVIEMMKKLHQIKVENYRFKLLARFLERFTCFCRIDGRQSCRILKIGGK